MEFLTRIAHFYQLRLENIQYRAKRSRDFGKLAYARCRPPPRIWNVESRCILEPLYSGGFGITWNVIDRSDVIKESDGPEVNPICQVNHGVVDTVRSQPFNQLSELI